MAESSPTGSPAVTPNALTDAEIRAELDRILTSPVFASQDRLQKFLTCVVERVLAGHADELKERTIGCEAFGRRLDYDPKTDPVVRVQARRLREKLADFYESHPGRTGIQIVLPKGSYVPEFIREAAPGPPQEFVNSTLTLAEPATPQANDGQQSLASVPGVGPGIRNDRRSLFFLLGCIATIVVLVLLASHRRPPPAPPAARIRLFLGGGGTYDHPAFSPDGHSLAFDWGGPNDDNEDVYVQNVDSDTPTRLTASAAAEERPAWSPDGKRIAFLRRISDERAAIVTISPQGGPERIVGYIAGFGTLPRIDWSPDGNSFVTSEAASPGSPKRRLVLISIDSGSERALTSPPLDATEDRDAAFSPDGSMVAFERSKGAAIQDIFVVPAHGGDPRRLTSDNAIISGLAWAPDRQSVLFISTRDGGAYALWRVPANGGSPVRLTATPSAAASPSVAPHGKRIAFSVRIQDENIWRMDLIGKEPPGVVIDSPQTDSTPAISPDGTTLAFRSSRTGQSEVWLSDRNGGSLKRLTHSAGAQAGSPDWSPDGRRIAYTAALNSVPHIWIIPRDGGAARRLTGDNDSESVPRWSPDGRSIYYASNASGSPEIWKKPIDGGPSVQITRGGATCGQESSDGQWLYFTKGELKPGLWRQPLGGGPEQEVAPQLPARLWGNWRAGKKGVYFLSFVWERPYSEKLYLFDPITTQTRLVASAPGIPAPFGAGLALSPDERWAYFVQVDHLGVSLYFAEDVTW